MKQARDSAGATGLVYDIPRVGRLRLKTIVLDLNGTVSVKGRLVAGVVSRIRQLKQRGYTIVPFTGNTRGDAACIAEELGIEWRQTANSEEKRAEVLKLGPETCVAIGNGLIDLELMQTVALRVLTLQAEGVHVQTLLLSDVVVPSINDALDMLIDPNILVATLRR